ncbi:EcoRI family type II restriction endonuclease [Campylobacter lanienae]|uniref:EcoRI family type II restriction endonuclease n=1 Tax=Campylobacter lanienae TaxID=75658 RepID=UPI000BB43B5C|nr:EcoRI family type II restriction endonuclease [Campylobacter lanienae]MDD5786447.1 EcoRI family type II restriction endonuclease [Campylobacter lanienae]TWO15135.1 restriction endonuclease [Campylobacter lanienae]
MASSDDLRKNKNQHKAKNVNSKSDDKNIGIAMNRTIEYLKNRFKNIQNFDGYYFEFGKSLSLKIMMDNIRNGGIRKQFDTNWEENTIIPDGGFLILKKKDDENYQKLLLAAEVKRQGTNDKRLAEGLKKQARGNAIERLGKNLIGIKAMMNHEDITPFVCFGHGDDFNQDDITTKNVFSKLSTMNEFYYLNKTYIFKLDGNSEHNKFAPVSMYFRKDEWSIDEMFEIMKEIAETSLRYYIF